MPDNSIYVPELVPGVLQPLEVNEIMEDPKTDKWLLTLDIEKIVQQAEQSMKHLDVQQDLDKGLK